MQPLRRVPKVLLSAANASAMLLYIITNAMLYSYLLTSEQIQQATSQWVLEKHLDPWMFLANVALLLAGQVMEPSSIILILAHWLLPIATSMGIDPIHWPGADHLCAADFAVTSDRDVRALTAGRGHFRWATNPLTPRALSFF